MHVEASSAVNRPISEVWDFYAVHHVQNHPRWDPDIALEATSTAPLGTGSIIARRNRRFGTTTQGTMEIVDFDVEQRMSVVIRERGAVIHGWATFAAEGPDRTRLTIGMSTPALDDAMADEFRPLMERSLASISRLIEQTGETGETGAPEGDPVA